MKKRSEKSDRFFYVIRKQVFTILSPIIIVDNINDYCIGGIKYER